MLQPGEFGRFMHQKRETIETCASGNGVQEVRRATDERCIWKNLSDYATQSETTRPIGSDVRVVSSGDIA